MTGAISHLQKQAQEVMRQKPKWQSYFQGQMITKDDYEFISNFDQMNAEGRAKCLADPNMRNQVSGNCALEKDRCIPSRILVCEDLPDPHVQVVQTADVEIPADIDGRMSSSECELPRIDIAKKASGQSPTSTKGVDQKV